MSDAINQNLVCLRSHDDDNFFIKKIQVIIYTNKLIVYEERNSNLGVHEQLSCPTDLAHIATMIMINGVVFEHFV